MSKPSINTAIVPTVSTTTVSELGTQCPSGNPCLLEPELALLRQEVERLSEMVSTDSMTGLFNYRHFCLVLEQEIDRSLRTMQHTTLIMVDADHFKKINDTWGHEVGNQALQHISHCIIQNIRKLDIACRYGGEEFAIILPSTDIVVGANVAERIRETLETQPVAAVLADGTSVSIPLTVSLGLSIFTGLKEETISDIVSAADEQLYLAKQNGRNQISFVKPEFNSHVQVSSEEKAALFDTINDFNH